MNNTTLAILALVAAFSAATTSSSQAQVVTGNEFVRIEVRVQTGQQRTEGKGNVPDTVTQEKTLNIVLTGKARTPETRKGTWQAYARDMKDNVLVATESGTFDIDFSKGAQKVESAKISTTYTPEYSSGGRGGKGGKGGGSKKVPAEGKKFAGYGVTVKDGEKVVGEFFDPPGLKAESKK